MTVWLMSRILLLIPPYVQQRRFSGVWCCFGSSMFGDNRWQTNIYYVILQKDFVILKAKVEAAFREGGAECEDNRFYPEGGSLTPNELTHCHLWPLRWVSISWNWHILRETAGADRVISTNKPAYCYNQWHTVVFCGLFKQYVHCQKTNS